MTFVGYVQRYAAEGTVRGFGGCDAEASPVRRRGESPGLAAKRWLNEPEVALDDLQVQGESSAQDEANRAHGVDFANASPSIMMGPSSMDLVRRHKSRQSEIERRCIKTPPMPQSDVLCRPLHITAEGEATAHGERPTLVVADAF